ncbi:uncharacterized protein LOC127749342 [Frankliniella occidentalis]|uniref:Uncharacterized protein LOC127749342 n=1 Tax=Frankliniella occidentalis TaxID=133901 RepID=A0A9C6WZJ6_FRAOC|nr:uncharacterized protein LOC127749342 [Frankliniella occidentalis]
MLSKLKRPSRDASAKRNPPTILSLPDLALERVLSHLSVEDLCAAGQALPRVAALSRECRALWRGKKASFHQLGDLMAMLRVIPRIASLQYTVVYDWRGPSDPFMCLYFDHPNSTSDFTVFGLVTERVAAHIREHIGVPLRSGLPESQWPLGLFRKLQNFGCRENLHAEALLGFGGPQGKAPAAIYNSFDDMVFRPRGALSSFLKALSKKHHALLPWSSGGQLPVETSSVGDSLTVEADKHIHAATPRMRGLEELGISMTSAMFCEKVIDFLSSWPSQPPPSTSSALSNLIQRLALDIGSTLLSLRYQHSVFLVQHRPHPKVFIDPSPSAVYALNLLVLTSSSDNCSDCSLGRGCPTAALLILALKDLVRRAPMPIHVMFRLCRSATASPQAPRYRLLYRHPTAPDCLLCAEAAAAARVCSDTTGATSDVIHVPLPPPLL